MKKIILIGICVIMLAILTGCFEVTTEQKLSAIGEALKNEEWVKNNLYMTKDCFGDEVTGNQEITFKKIGEDRVIVQALSYDSDAFGVVLTVVYYKDGKVMTYSYPSLDEPLHPGHLGFNVDPDNQILVSYFMHMGFYEDVLYTIGDNSIDDFARFAGAEMDEEGNIRETESGDTLVDYEFINGDEKEEGTMTFSEYYKYLENYRKEYNFQAIDTPLTAENVDLYVR